MHNWLVGLVLEIAVPTRAELWARPLIHHIKFLFSGADLDTGFNTVGSKGASAVGVPLVEHPFLGRWITTSKVIERLDVRLRTVCGERETDSKVSKS